MRSSERLNELLRRQLWRRQPDGITVNGEWLRICAKHSPDVLADAAIGKTITTVFGTHYTREG